MRTPIRRALLSVYDKTGIVDFARELQKRGVLLVSSGGTAQAEGESSSSAPISASALPTPSFGSRLSAQIGIPTTPIEVGATASEEPRE